jgi:hypothetical protein
VRFAALPPLAGSFTRLAGRGARTEFPMELSRRVTNHRRKAMAALCFLVARQSRRQPALSLNYR